MGPRRPGGHRRHKWSVSAPQSVHSGTPRPEPGRDLYLMTAKRVALLTAGGYAPCLSSAVGGLIERYDELVPDVEIIAYKHGYWGLLSGEKIVVDDEVRAKAGVLHNYGGSPIGNSRVK